MDDVTEEWTGHFSGTNSREYYDKYLIHPTNSSKLFLLIGISPHVF